MLLRFCESIDHVAGYGPGLHELFYFAILLMVFYSGHILEAAGTNYSNVVKTTVLLKNMEDFGKVNDVSFCVYPENFPQDCVKF